jgi:hypothetical protein
MNDERSRRDVLRDKVMARVVIDEDGCYIWQGPDSGNGRGGGYPRMNVDNATMAVHIVMWVIEHGPIPPRKQLDHRCRKRRCVNPFKCTELVTHLENQKRRAKAARTCKS